MKKKCKIKNNQYLSAYLKMGPQALMVTKLPLTSPTFHYCKGIVLIAS